MKPIRGLSRQIALTMATIALGVTLFMLLGSYIFYGLMLLLVPAYDVKWVPTPLEVAWMMATALVAITMATYAAIKLSRRILAPLNSVANSLRAIAKGDLTARAAHADRSLGEAGQLVHHFNEMAIRLQRVEQERTFWNAAIAHELRTPVTILRGRLQGLTEGIFAPDPALFHTLLKQVEGLNHLIEDLRVVGLADSGHLNLQLVAIELAAEIEAVVHACECSLQLAGFDVALDLHDQPVMCDPIRIRQMVLALLENAIRHAEPGPLCIQTHLADGICHLRIEDSGPGIAAAIAGDIFKAFQRGDRSDSGAPGGSGLGLAVVDTIARAHGGRALCRPSKLGGSLFEVSWPAGTPE